jgi:hypothetical protein
MRSQGAAEDKSVSRLQSCAIPEAAVAAPLENGFAPHVLQLDVCILVHDSPEASGMSWSPQAATELGLCSNWWLC